jgi:putative two-component system response regulator
MKSALADSGFALLNLARTIALTHHERWDDTGYPRGLAGEAIPLAGRIVAIADVFDALTSARPYKQPWSIQDAVAFIVSGARQHFDPQLTIVFVRELPRILELKDLFPDEPAPALGSKPWLYRLNEVAASTPERRSA